MVKQENQYKIKPKNLNKLCNMSTIMELKPQEKAKKESF